MVASVSWVEPVYLVIFFFWGTSSILRTFLGGTSKKHTVERQRKKINRSFKLSKNLFLQNNIMASPPPPVVSIKGSCLKHIADDLFSRPAHLPLSGCPDQTA